MAKISTTDIELQSLQPSSSRRLLLSKDQYEPVPANDDGSDSSSDSPALPNPPVPSGSANPPQPPDLTEHFAKLHKEYLRLHEDFTRNWEPYLQFLTHMFRTLLFETTLLRIATLVADFFASNGTFKGFIVLGLHVITCLISSYLTTFAQPSSRRDDSWKNFRKFICQSVLNTCCVAKLYRHYRLYNQRKEHIGRIRTEQLSTMQTIQRNNARQQYVTRQMLVSLTKIPEAELKDIHENIYEVFFQLIPMAGLQAMFLFNTLQFCTFQDLLRLYPIIMPFLVGACEISSLESTTFEYEQSLYLLDYYDSRATRDFVVFPERKLGYAGITNFLQHFFTMVHRFYTATYFLVISPVLAVVYATSVFAVNAILLYIFPGLLSVHQNPPFGISTRRSYWADRFFNIFCNVGTRFAGLSRSTLKSKIEKLLSVERKNRLNEICTHYPILEWILDTRLPLAFLQIVTSGVPVLITLWVKSTWYDDLSTTAGLTSPTVVPCPGKQTADHDNEFLEMLSDSLFASYKNVFPGYGDVFQVKSMLLRSFVVHILAMLLHALVDKRLRKKESPDDDPLNLPKYPLYAGHMFYKSILNNIMSTRGADRLSKIRKLMVVTVAREQEFYSALRWRRVFWKSIISDADLDSLADIVVSRLNIRLEAEVVAQTEEILNAARRQNHRFYPEFQSLRNEFYDDNSNATARDKELLMGFTGFFDKKVCVMSSDRMKRIFRIMDMQVSKHQEITELEAVNGRI